ncbi:PAS domain S-box protein [Insolitispirillum peregrinum]|uniref:PAS domain S-box protein n=1 Tax=Insolitispirillum peregrinum TaxID=80876 RepID=UPI00360E9E2E
MPRAVPPSSSPPSPWQGPSSVPFLLWPPSFKAICTALLSACCVALPSVVALLQADDGFTPSLYLAASLSCALAAVVCWHGYGAVGALAGIILLNGVVLPLSLQSALLLTLTMMALALSAGRILSLWLFYRIPAALLLQRVALGLVGLAFVLTTAQWIFLGPAQRMSFVATCGQTIATLSILTPLMLAICNQRLGAFGPLANDLPAPYPPLRLLRSQVQDLLDSAPVPAALFYASGDIIAANEAYLLLIGSPKASNIQVESLFEDPVSYRDMLDRTLRLGRIEGYEHRLYRLDGGERWVQEWWRTVDLGGQQALMAWSYDVSSRKADETQLKTSERRLRSILDDSPAAVVISRPGGSIVYANPKAAALVSLPRALLIGSDGRSFYADPAELQRLARVIHSGGTVVNDEVDLRSALGVLRTCLISIMPVDFDGAPARLTWLFDITARKAAERGLRTSQQRLHAILEASPLGMAAITGEGDVRYANPALLAMIGVDPHQQVPRLHRLLRNRTQGRWLLRTLHQGETLRGVEAEICRADGSSLWCLLNFEHGSFGHEPVTYVWAADISERKQAERALAAHRDELAQAVQDSTRELALLNRQLSRELDDRKRAEENIRRSETYLRTMLDTVADGIVTLDEHGLIENFNPAAEQIFGYRQQEVQGKNAAVLIPPSERSQPDNPLRTLPAGTTAQRREGLGLRRDGSVFPLSLAVSAAPLGERTIYTGVLRDITEQKQTEASLLAAKEEAELANRSKSEFLANMSHELRTPLNAILGFSEIMKSELLGPLGNDRYLEYVGDIMHSGRHLLDVINDILDIARVEARQMTLHEEETDIAAAIASSLKLIQPRAYQARQRLICDIPQPLPLIWADSRRVKQMTLNLLSNASKFTPDGGTITISAEITDYSLRIQVKDTGIGMTRDQCKAVLQPFVQVDSGLGRRFDGTGLGLPLVAAMVEMHQGQFHLTSDPGQGTTASLDFPLSRIIETSASPKAVSNTQGSGS